ncbi:MAG TPA: S8 family serine peptidase [Gaiellaceae bacterium]|nr:S8 family serine peptidase [Gaiellaceae bacterium]
MSSAAVTLAGDGLGAAAHGPTTEVVVTLAAPPLSAFGRSLQSATHDSYLRRVTAAQDALARRVRSALPAAQVRWRYRLVANGFAVVLPRSEVDALARVPGVERVWPSVRYHALAVRGGPEQIGADKLWGASFETAGNGMKIGIVDDGLDASNPYFNPSGFTYPPGFPKGQTQYTTPKVIVQRTFAPASPQSKYANTPFDPTESFHATHVAGIAAGIHGINVNGTTISGVAPNAYLGNYKALTTPTPDFGLDGNSAELAAAIEAAVADGMNVINLSLGEPEIEPSRDVVVQALEGAAAAGVVPVVAAGNDFGDFGYGTVSSPGNAPSAITVAAVTSRNSIADFSSAGPTPVSLAMKPDVAAPGVGILSSLPASQGTFGLLSGTSMASPHVAGAAALLKERHPTWTVAQIKSALEQSGDAIGSPVTRQGGGVVDLPRADNPLLFATPTGLSFGLLAPGSSATRTVELSDAGGGGGVWSVSATGLTAPATVTVPGTLDLAATASGRGDVSGFVTLTRGADVRRIPYWYAVSAPKLAGERHLVLRKAGLYRGTTRGGASLVGRYSYPTGGDDAYAGPERVYRITITGHPANAGVVVLSGNAVPHVVFAGHEDHLVGYTGLPTDLNPYRSRYGQAVRAAGLVLPADGPYDAVFDTRSAAAAGPFTFRYWVNDVKPPRLRVASTLGRIAIAATDTGSGVDFASLTATVDGRPATARVVGGVIRIPAAKGRHKVVVTVGDFQETRNMEDVGPVLPNTGRLSATVTVR